ncbi:MAG: hypothetical protein RMA76_35815 [Deltaproteobacteria bacterium]|jgi:hypothetical protein
MAKRPRQPGDRLGGGNVPEDEFDEGPDTNVDERPAVQLSPLEPDGHGDTTVDQAPTIDPTTRRPVGARLTRPIRERQAPSRPAAAPPPPPPKKPDKNRLRLPLPAGMGGAPADDDADTPVPALVSPSSSPSAAPPREPSKPGSPVPVMPGVERRRAQWPIVAAVAAVAVIAVAFLVASDNTDGTGSIATLGPNATADARQAELLRRAREGGNVHPDGSGATGLSRQRPVIKGAVVSRKTPSVKPRRPAPARPEKRPVGQSLLGHAPSTDDYPKYPDDVAPPETRTILLVQSDPTGVVVRLDGMLIGNTPVMLPLTEDRKGGAIEYTLPGLKTKTVNFTVEGPGLMEIFEKLEVDEIYMAKKRARAAQMKNNPLE